MSGAANTGEELSPQQLEDLARGDAQLVDVRTDDEYAAGRIAGSLHIELDRLPTEAERIDRDRPVVFLCRSGSRSELATQAFRAAGYDAYNLGGGLLAWTDRGLPLEPEGASVAGPRA